MVGNEYNVVSLFSGAMGLDIGFERAGRFRGIACVENEHAFCETIRANIKSGRLNASLMVFEHDIAELDPLEVLNAIGLKPGELDLLAGGPPCQSFSTAGKRGTIQDPRGTLLRQFLRFVECSMPPKIVMKICPPHRSPPQRQLSIPQPPQKYTPPLTPNK